MIRWWHRLRARAQWLGLALKFGRRLVALFRWGYGEVEKLRYEPRPGQECMVDARDMTLTSARKRKELMMLLEQTLIQDARSFGGRHRRRFMKAAIKDYRTLLEKIWKAENPGSRPKSFLLQDCENVLDPELNRPLVRLP